jgi:ParB family chromosome partitioning protein
MKLPTNNASHIKVPLSCLKITDNVRMNFDEAEIEELANSIRQNGLMNPITVRPPETDADGNKTYEVIAGGRRIRAHQWLCEHGDDFSLIECCIRTGDKWALQMIENIQRTDLTPREKENAVAKALKEGLTQTQIADKLSKPIQWVSDIVAGAKIRKIADAAGLNTEEITTKTLSQLRSIPEEKLESCLTQLIAEGGTYRAATRMMQEEKNPATTHVSTPDEDFISDDESMISPTEMSEKDFHDDVDFEKDRKESRFVVGTEIDIAGERLFFKNLWHARYVVLKIHGKNIVCIVSSSLYAEPISFFYRENEDFSKDRTVKLSVSEIDSEIENEQYNIYAIPDNAKAIRKPDLSKKNDSDLEEKTKQKGFANPVSKEIQKRWVVFCRDKKIPESDKTAFKFYQELTAYFENTRK